MTPTEPCSKCNSPLDTTGYPKWCKSCRAAHKREYEATKKEMQESRGFAAGQSAMRSYLVQQFARYGTQGAFTGYEIARMIQNCKGPTA